jgi:hypothetical protein
VPEPRAFLPPGSATMDDLLRLDLRVGRIVDARVFAEARKSAYQLDIDFGPGGVRRSSAQLPGTYPDPSQLVGRLVAWSSAWSTSHRAEAPDSSARCWSSAASRRTGGSRFWASTRVLRPVMPSAEHGPGERPRRASHDTPREYAGWRLRLAGWRANVCRPGRAADAPEDLPEPTGRPLRCGHGLRDMVISRPCESGRGPAHRLRGRTRPGAMTAIDGCQASLACCPW